jgi:hypothetical protein
MSRDKQLLRIRFKDVLEKSRRDQALNAKEFAVLAGISYSTAREWFQLPGFPRVQGVVFWQDFVEWRKTQNGRRSPLANPPPPTTNLANNFSIRGRTASSSRADSTRINEVGFQGELSSNSLNKGTSQLFHFEFW